MSPLVRQKTADAVAEHLIALIFDGTLRGGDRIDLDALARDLGVSRAPVREALAQLERDGLVVLAFHRGAYVAPFDVSTVGQGFELYALLNGWASGEAATRHDPGTLAALSTVYGRITAATDADALENEARDFRRVVNVSVAGPHLRALLRSFSGLVPTASRLAIPHLMDEVPRHFGEELEAHRGGDGEQAAAVAAALVRRIGRQAVVVLQARGVLSDGGSPAS